MLAFVPTVFDLYRPLRPHLRWTMQCLVSFADRAGRCFPSVRKLAEQAEISKSTAARHLSALVGSGVVTRKRRPGGVYDYQIDRRFLPRAPVSHHQAEGVPRQTGQETEPGKQTREARKRAQFAKPGLSFGEIPDERPSGRRGCAAGGSRAFGSHYGAASRARPVAWRQRHC